MRCFLAWTPEAAARRELVALIDELAQERPDSGYRWAREDQLHITLRFLGQSTREQLDALAPGMDKVAAETGPIAAWTAGWQYWPSSAAPRVLVLRIESEPRLADLAARLEGLSQSVGFSPEKRAFRAHLTLARIDRLRARPKPFAAPPPRIALPIDHVGLIGSEPGPRGSRYTELVRATLAGVSFLP